jgi:hypothetical protein
VCGRKRFWPNLRLCPGKYLNRLKRNKKIKDGITGLWAKIVFLE